MEALKSLVKSIDERTAPYEHLVRTKAWVEQSPPPPNRKPSSKKVMERIPYPSSSTREKSSTDFVVDVAKSLQSFERSSFIQQVTGRFFFYIYKYSIYQMLYNFSLLCFTNYRHCTFLRNKLLYILKLINKYV